MAGVACADNTEQPERAFCNHDGWFRRKVEESLADGRGVVAHDQVMADVEAVISEAEARRRSS